MADTGSVTHWIVALKDGDLAAAQPLWKRYYRQLVVLARNKLGPSRRREADEEDVVQVAFQSFFRSIAEGRFPELADRDGLWRLLVVITAKKALKQLTYEQRLKRGGTPPGGTGIYPIETAEFDAGDRVAALVDREPTSEFAVQVVDECRRLLALLGDETLRQVAVWKMEGYSNDEIAGKLGCSRRTVARKLDAIRIIWNKEPTR
jgi:DNA-directed RNA polymerase specialized sigma24 family protein